ncbi:hypothetical protein [Streptomyces radicis]|uniref:Uncharacterized protein n=1 Tax=Streptomyces radicis TaxID=1750517 RepID=A0A3A9W3N9_9ACTN|nr:hypothetical protein [Streptomyces radicis]RKN07033.1 hypothetical protein D7319_20285 [Streptomyces radicis]RKN15094.1 hypothetical protein D7318_28155 [Streptomyces radicis]
MDKAVRLWRWRRNPLRRGSDVAEAWVGLAVGLTMAVGAPLAGAAMAVGAAEGMLDEGDDLRATTAVVVTGAPVPGIVGPGGKGLAAVRWTDDDGTARVGATHVAFGADEGSRVTIWLDEQGRIKDAPAGPAEVWAGATLLGAVTTAGVCVLAAGARLAARRHLARRRAARWEREWTAVEPLWCDRAA